MSICLPEIVKDAIARSIDSPLAHYSFPCDPSQRTALCSVELLGVEACGPYTLCSTCEYIEGRVNWSLLPEKYGGPSPGQKLARMPLW